MVLELLVTVGIIITGCFVFMPIFDLVKNETVRALMVVAYGLFTIALLAYWLVTNMI